MSLISIVIGILLSFSRFGIELICEISRLCFSVGFYYFAGALEIMSSLKTELTRLILDFGGTVTIFPMGLVRS